MKILFNHEVKNALQNKQPIVALESTVIAHGLPYPENIQTAEDLEEIVRKNGAVPATIAVFNGDFFVGLTKNQIEELAAGKNIRKISRRDLPVAVAKKLNCATTVATTMFIAHAAGIKVFATGGIGGVHRGFSADVSADLPELAKTPMITVCSGAKIILDLPATREWLETYGITVLGYKCSEFPAFYSHKSGLTVDERVETVSEIVEIAEAAKKMGSKNAILVTVPVPKEFEIESQKLEEIIEKCMQIAREEKIQGKNLTPFLLSKMSEFSRGETLRANIELLKNNARVASKIAVSTK